MILVLSSFKETHVSQYGSVLFMNLMALSLIKCFFWKEVCICLMNAYLMFKATCFWLSTVVKLILVSMIIWLKTCVYDRFIEHALDSVQI